MANSRFSYVRNFELSDQLLPSTYLLIRLDGHSFHRFTSLHGFTKPNDPRGLELMNHAAREVMLTPEWSGEIRLAFGQSDEMSFLLRKSCTLWSRRSSKLLSSLASLFTSLYVLHFPRYFPDTPLQYPPSFDGRIVQYPTEEVVRDYFHWRAADTHINNLYNTTFWALVQNTPRDEDYLRSLASSSSSSSPSSTKSVTPATAAAIATTAAAAAASPASSLSSSSFRNSQPRPPPMTFPLTESQAHQYLKGTFSRDKHDVLFRGYGINYANEADVFKRGSTLVWVSQEGKKSSSSRSISSSANGTATTTTKSAAKRRVVETLHVDLITGDFWGGGDGDGDGPSDKDKVSDAGGEEQEETEADQIGHTNPGSAGVGIRVRVAVDSSSPTTTTRRRRTMRVENDDDDEEDPQSSSQPQPLSFGETPWLDPARRNGKDKGRSVFL